MKFKRALFAFFKEEILKEVKYNYPSSLPIILPPEPPLIRGSFGTTIYAEILLEDSIDKRAFETPSEHYQKALLAARKCLFDEFCKYVKVDDWSIVDPRIHGDRILRVYVNVSKPS